MGLPSCAAVAVKVSVRSTNVPAVASPVAAVPTGVPFDRSVML